MAKIRRGTVGAATNVKNVDWNDSYEFDRTAVDNEMSGKPVEMKRGGSGSLTLTAGSIASGYSAADLVITYKEVSVAAGVETETEKTATFTDVTFNTGGSIDNDAGPGEIRISFDYATSALA